MDATKVLIVDDEEKILDVLESYLVNDGYEVIKALNGLEGMESFYLKRPDLAILDLMLPDMNGEEMCREIRKVSKIPIIMLTAKAGEHNIIKGLDLGADDYITKPFRPKELVARVKALIRRAKGVTESEIFITNDKRVKLDYEKKEVVIDGVEVKLTSAEYRILEFMSKNIGRVFKRDELLNIISGNDFSSYDRTVDSHIKNIRLKIEKNSKEPQYILTVFGIGYKFGG